MVKNNNRFINNNFANLNPKKIFKQIFIFIIFLTEFCSNNSLPKWSLKFKLKIELSLIHCKNIKVERNNEL